MCFYNVNFDKMKKERELRERENCERIERENCERIERERERIEKELRELRERIE